MPEALPSGVRLQPPACWGRGSNTTEGMDVLSCVRWVLCKQRPLRRVDNSFRGVLAGVSENLKNEVA
jgi:hypothetical protein